MVDVASAVRIPSPEPELPELPRKRDRSPAIDGPSKRSRFDDNDDDDDRPRERRREWDDRQPRFHREDERNDNDNDVDRPREHRRDRDRPRAPPQESLVKEDDERFAMFKKSFGATKKLAIDDSNTRAGGAYIPPAKLRAMQAAITDKSGKEYQRMAWEALKKSIQGIINKCNIANIKMIVPELFEENLIRGRGLFCRSIMKAQAASQPFTPIYAAMVAIVNTKLPQVGDLLVRRLIMSFRKSFKRNDKVVAKASSTFVCHLVNQQVCGEMLAGQMLLLLLNKPTDDSVEIAVEVTREVGAFLEEMRPAIAGMIFDQFRKILHDGSLDVRTQYMIEVLFQARKDRYKDNPAVKPELDLVEEEDQITHHHDLQDTINVEDGLNIFKFDPEYEEHEAQYQKIKGEILGEVEGSDADEYTDASSDDDEEDEEQRALEIKDQTNADLTDLRKKIYLTIKASGGFEECVHKLMRIDLPVGREGELISMIIESATQERTYEKFYGQIGERFAKLNRMWRDLFEDNFIERYNECHRLDTNKIRIVATFYAYLLATDAIGWHVLMAIKLNESDTTSSSRIFIKDLFTELLAELGEKKLVERLNDPELQESTSGLFPTDSRANATFAINYFTAIKMGVLTEGMRKYLRDNPVMLKPLPEPESDSDSDSVSSYSSYSSRSRSRSRTLSRSRQASRSSSRGRGRSLSYSRSRSPGRRGRDRSYSRSHSSDSRSPSRSPIRRRGRGPRSSRSYSSDSRSRSRSRSPVNRRRYTSSISRSRSPVRSRRARSPSSSRSRSPVRNRRGRDASSSVSRSRSPPRRTRHSSSASRSRSPPRRSRNETRSRPTRGGSRSISPPAEFRKRRES